MERRFDQDALKVAAQREATLIAAANNTFSGLDLVQIPDVIDRVRLERQLQMLGDLTKPGTVIQSIHDVARLIDGLHEQTRGIFKETEMLVELCACLPVSAASSERSFSSLRRLKTWLRSTISQKRLTHLALMHAHCDILDKVDIACLVKSFISNTPERKSTFGAV